MFVCLFRLLLIGGCVMVLCVSLGGGFVVVCVAMRSLGIWFVFSVSRF